MTSRGPSGTGTLARDRPGRTRGAPVKPQATWAEVGEGRQNVDRGDKVWPPGDRWH
jgi:hypothetical protein